MKFGLLIEHNMRNIFLEKPYKKCGGEVGPRPFYKKIKISNVMSRSRSPKIYQPKGADHLLLPYIKLFYKTQRLPSLLPLVSLYFDFCMILEKKFSHYISY